MNVIFLDFDGVLDTNYYRSNEQIEEKIKILADICHEYDCKVVIESSHKDMLDEKTLEIIDPECDWLVKLMNKLKKYGIEVIGRTPNLTSKYHYDKHSEKYIDLLIKNYNEKYYHHINQLERLNKTEFNEESKPIYEEIKRYSEEFINRYPKLSDYLNERMYSKVNIWKEDEIRLYLMRHPEIEHYCVIDDDDLAAMHRTSDLDKVRSHLVVTNWFSESNPEDEGLQLYHKEEVGKILKKDNEVRNFLLRKKARN